MCIDPYIEAVPTATTSQLSLHSFMHSVGLISLVSCNPFGDINMCLCFGIRIIDRCCSTLPEWNLIIMYMCPSGYFYHQNGLTIHKRKWLYIMHPDDRVKGCPKKYFLCIRKWGPPTWYCWHYFSDILYFHSCTVCNNYNNFICIPLIQAGDKKCFT